MAAVRGRDTKPELIIRSALHHAGFRFRLNRRDVPGKPDLLLPRYRAALFVHGCFWHGHDCDRFRQPGGDNAEFWRQKIGRNRARDAEVTAQLARAGWRQMVVWECAFIGRRKRDIDDVAVAIADWLRSTEQRAELAGCMS